MASSVSLCVGCGKDLTDCSKTRKKVPYNCFACLLLTLQIVCVEL